jgi:hypothetical protein
MGYIKEPAGVDLNIEPMPLSVEERQAVSAIIAQYKITGKMPKILSKTKVSRKKKLSSSAVMDRPKTTKPKQKKKAISVSESGK